MSGDTNGTVPPSTVIAPAQRPAVDQTRSTRAAESRDRVDADPLGIRRVFVQVSHDLYGTKDVQDVITASYVWMADQIGHLFLGLVPTLLLAWFCAAVAPYSWLRELATILLALAMWGYWVSKEFQDFSDTKTRAGKVFEFDSSDIWWNVKTALLYFGIGGVWAVSAFSWPPLLLAAVLVSAWPGVFVAYWWLRRKLAFQQAGLPYLYRLANFQTALDTNIVAAIGALANLKERPVAMWRVLLGVDTVPSNAPPIRHILITGPLNTGKTSLAVGLGTEFAFALGLGRYMSAAILVQTLATAKGPANQMEYADGRVLWPLRECQLLVVDDIDAGVMAPDGTMMHLLQPADLAAALTACGQDAMHWLRDRRSVWVLGDASAEAVWKSTIAGFLGVGATEILTVDLTPKPSMPPVV